MDIQILCNPGMSFAACNSQRWGCSQELFDEIFAAAKAEVSSIEDLGERNYRAVIFLYRLLKEKGLKEATYCDKCGHRAMEYELEARRDA